MLPATLISNLKNDTTLRSLLGATSPDNTPIQSSFMPAVMPDKLVVVSIVLGETFHLGFENGVCSIDVYIKDSIDQPIKVLLDIVNRICEVLDLKGSQLQDVYTARVYRMRKVDFNQVYDNVSHFYVGSIDWEYYVTR